MARPTAAAAPGVVSFLKASLWLSPILRVAPGENPDPSDQAVAAPWCCSLPVGAVLETIVRQTRLRLLVGCRSCLLAPMYLALGVCGVVSSCMLVLYGGCFIYKAGQKPVSW